ncbi:MAG: NifU family protein [Cytophagales bacterium]|nr:NifU family protein [Cytophagales bacterium]
MTRYVNIYTEANPNPNSLKFVANFMLVPENVSFDYPDAPSAAQSPLAMELFGFDYVRRVFFMNNFVTITKDETTEWNEVIPAMRAFLKEYFEQNKPVLAAEKAQTTHTVFNDDDPEVVKKIKHLLDEYVRPAVESDGGAISFHSFDEGTVKLLLQGSCSGCPSSTLTLKAGIENLLKRMLPEVKEVVAEGV